MFEAFRQFLLRKASIKSQYIPFYLKWMSDCYGYLNTPPDSRLSSEVSSRNDWNFQRGLLNPCYVLET